MLLVLVAGGLVFSGAKPPMVAAFEDDKGNVSAAPQSKPAAGGAESTAQAWVAQPTGQNMVSLQTCVGPGWSERLVVRAVMI